MRTASTCERGDSSLGCCGVMLPAGRLVSPSLRGVDSHSFRLRGGDHRPCLRRGWHPLRDSQSRIARLTGQAKIGVNPMRFSRPAEAATSATISGVPIICSFQYNRSHVRRPFAATFHAEHQGQEALVNLYGEIIEGEMSSPRAWRLIKKHFLRDWRRQAMLQVCRRESCSQSLSCLRWPPGVGPEGTESVEIPTHSEITHTWNRTMSAREATSSFRCVTFYSYRSGTRRASIMAFSTEAAVTC